MNARNRPPAPYAQFTAQLRISPVADLRAIAALIPRANAGADVAIDKILDEVLRLADHCELCQRELRETNLHRRPSVARHRRTNSVTSGRLGVKHHFPRHAMLVRASDIPVDSKISAPSRFVDAANAALDVAELADEEGGHRRAVSRYGRRRAVAPNDS